MGQIVTLTTCGHLQGYASISKSSTLPERAQRRASAIGEAQHGRALNILAATMDLQSGTLTRNRGAKTGIALPQGGD